MVRGEPTALGRRAVRPDGLVLPDGCRKPHRSPEERLRRFERDAQAYEVVPAFMHTLGRVLSGKNSETMAEERLGAAVGRLGDDASCLVTALENYEKLDVGLKTRALSARYLSMGGDRPISDAELGSMFAQANPVGTAIGLPGADLLPAVQRANFRLTYSHLFCVDESNPEFAGSDEPYAVFATTTEAMVLSGVDAFGAKSPVYEDVDDGDRRPRTGEANVGVYGPAGPMPIDSPFLTVSTFFEHDAGAPSAAVGNLRSTLTSVATTAAGVGGPAGWIVAAAAGIGVAVTFLVDLWASDDQIGRTLTIAFTEAQAHAATANVNPAVLPPLHFDGGSDDGIYNVFLKLERS